MDRWPPSLHGLLEDDPNAFKDSEFPHDGRSTKGHQTEHPSDVWVRARMLGDASEAVLFDQIRPQDVTWQKDGKPTQSYHAKIGVCLVIYRQALSSTLFPFILLPEFRNFNWSTCHCSLSSSV